MGGQGTGHLLGGAWTYVTGGYAGRNDVQVLAVCDVWLLRLRALLARAHDDATAYAQLRDRYRDMARAFGVEGHIEWSEAML